MIDRHLINLAVALQYIDDDVPRLQTWGRAAASALAAGGRLFACAALNSAIRDVVRAGQWSAPAGNGAREP